MSDDFRQHLKRHGYGGRYMSKIRIGDVDMSIQASDCHYSTPRMIVNTNAYVAWEVAIFRDKGPWLAVKGHEALWQGDDVAGYVPTATVQALYDAIRDGSAVLVECSDTDPREVLNNFATGQAPAGTQEQTP